MKKPNFFILGAPKCGTTSLAGWLSEHPQIYMSPVKEPHFFNTDSSHVQTRSSSHYHRLFAGASTEHKAVGEASVWYLYSDRAVPNILDYEPNARFIVFVRNPVEMAYSLHEQQVVSGNEHIRSFEEAWRVQNQRLRGKAVTRSCRDPRHLVYGRVCALGAQVERLYGWVDRERLLVIVLDDMREDSRREYRRVLGFLDVPDDGRAEFAVHNPAKERRSRLLQKAVLAVRDLKRGLGIHRGLGILNAVDRRNVLFRPRPALSVKFRKELQRYFTLDVEILGRLLNRDLTNWVRR